MRARRHLLLLLTLVGFLTQLGLSCDPLPLPTLMETAADPAVAVIVLLSDAVRLTSPAALIVLGLITALISPVTKLPEPEPANARALPS